MELILCTFAGIAICGFIGVGLFVRALWPVAKLSATEQVVTADIPALPVVDHDAETPNLALRRPRDEDVHGEGANPVPHSYDDPVVVRSDTTVYRDPLQAPPTVPLDIKTRRSVPRGATAIPFDLDKARREFEDTGEVTDDPNTWDPNQDWDLSGLDAGDDADADPDDELVPTVVASPPPGKLKS